MVMLSQVITYLFATKALGFFNSLDNLLLLLRIFSALFLLFINFILLFDKLRFHLYKTLYNIAQLLFIKLILPQELELSVIKIFYPIFVVLSDVIKVDLNVLIQISLSLDPDSVLLALDLLCLVEIN
jgi:hypothetical protein